MFSLRCACACAYSCFVHDAVCCLDLPLCPLTAGTYKPTVGSAPCTACTAGKYGTMLGAEDVGNCVSCTQAKYQPGRGSTACLSCGIATTSNGAFTECVCRKGFSSLPDGEYRWRIQGSPPFNVDWTRPESASMFRISALCPETLTNNQGPPIDGGGWTLVRRVPRGSEWHPATDNCAGTQTYGPPVKLTDWQSNNIGNGWSINFEDAVSGYNEMLFATGDAQVWLITTKDAVGGQFVGDSVGGNLVEDASEWYADSPRTILKSSDSPEGPPYLAKWYNRGQSNPEDPWISVIDYLNAWTSKKIVYGEARHGSVQANVLQEHNGANVFIRKTTRVYCGIGDFLNVTLSGLSLKQIWYFRIRSLPIIVHVVANASGFEVEASDSLEPQCLSESISQCSNQTWIPFPNQFGLLSATASPFLGQSSRLSPAFVSITLINCSACIPGKYKDTDSMAACLQCPGGQYTAEIARTECQICPVRTYAPPNASFCRACPIHTTSQNSSDEVIDCKCNEGYTGPDGGLCAACPFDKYKNTTGSTPCIPCAAGKFSKQPGLASTICLTCAEDPTNEPCRDCPAGKFRNGTQINILRPEAQAIVDWGRAHNLSPNGTTVNPIPNCGGTQRTGDKCRCPAGDACLECRRCKIWH